VRFADDEWIVSLRASTSPERTLVRQPPRVRTHTTLILESNIWRYIVDAKAVEVVQLAERAAATTIPTAAFPDPRARRARAPLTDLSRTAHESTAHGSMKSGTVTR
jgi:hypothetical protein